MFDKVVKCLGSPTLKASFWGVVLQGVWVPDVKVWHTSVPIVGFKGLG